MKKYIYYIIIFIYFENIIYSQISQPIQIFEKVINRNDDLSQFQSDVDLKATQEINLTSGFYFSTYNNSTSFNAQVAPKEIVPADINTLEGGPAGTIGELVGNDGVVGSIPGKYMVSNLGAATYTIPIECPEGINGMTPNVALTYNSRSGNSIAGFGWGISGISAITRVPKTKYYDTGYQPIKWNSNDAFAYNGIRMFEVAINGTVKEYRLENDPTIKILGRDCGNDGPHYFEVYLKNGEKEIYGETTNSKFSPTSSIISNEAPGTYSFYISSKIDIFNNKMIYEYNYDITTNSRYIHKTNFRIGKIDYSSNNSHNTIYSILFTYEDRLDTLRTYIYNTLNLNNKRLRNISINYLNTPIRKYTVDYEYDNFTFVKSINLEGKNDSKYNKTVFERGMSNRSHIESIPEISIDKSIMSISSCDLDGNGISDILLLEATQDIDQNRTYYYKIYLRKKINGILTTTYTLEFQLPNTFVELDYNTNALPSLTTQDMNNDGKDEILMAFINGDNITLTGYTLTYDGYYALTPSVGIGDNYRFTFKGTGYSGNKIPYYALANLNGDNNLDLIAINKNYNTDGNYEIYTWMGTNEPNGFDQNLNYISDTNIEDFYITDANGDGLDDILLLRRSISECAINPGNGDFSSYVGGGLIGDIRYDEENSILASAYLNNDNLLDLVIIKNKTIYIALNNLSSYNLISTGLTVSYETERGDNVTVNTIDLQDDGFIDIKICNDIHEDNIFHNFLERKIYTIYNSSGTTFELSPNVIETPNYNDKIGVGDFNGDGTIDLISNSHDNFEFMNISSRDCGKYIYKKIYNGIGNEININYTGLIKDEGWDFNDTENCYSTDNSQHYSDLMTIATNKIKVVKNVDDGLTMKSFHYHDAILELNGKGFVGFEKTSVDDLASGTKYTQLYLPDPDYHFILNPHQLIKSLIENQTDISFFENEYEAVPMSTDDLQFQSRLIKNTSKDYLNDSKVITDYESCDAYGNSQLITTSTYKISGSIPENTLKNYISFNNIDGPLMGKWIIGQIARDSIYMYRNFPSFGKSMEYEYYTSGALHYKYIHKNSSLEIKEEYIYDEFGNITTTNSSAENDINIPVNLQLKTFSNTFSPDGRFLLTAINPDGQRTDFKYYEDLGLVETKTDYDNNLTIKYQYDDFGRLIKTIYPNGLQEALSLHWVDGQADAPLNSVTYKISQASGKDDRFTFFDKYGRELRMLSRNFNGDNIYIDNEYTPQNQLYKTSLPYKSTESPAGWNTYTYDDFGRKEQEDFPDDGYRHFDFSSPGQVTIRFHKGVIDRYETKYYNSIGDITKTTDYQGNEVEVTYWSSGLPRKYMYGSNAVSLIYDVNGNRTWLSDPNAGEINSTYNAWSELTQRVDQKGNKIKLLYDNLSRITSEQQYKPDSQTAFNIKTYIYDTDFVGAIGSVNQTNRSNTVIYHYDEFGNIIETSEQYYTDASSNYITVINKSEYDELYRIKSRTYPSGLEVNYIYTSNGFLKTINALNKVIWQCESINSIGQIEEYSMGNKTSTNSHNNFGILTSMIFSQSCRMDYNFGDLGNLESRSYDPVPNEERFQYDDMNRLEHIKFYINGVYQSGDMDMYYDENGLGNIISKTDVGNIIRYGEPDAGEHVGPNALTSIHELNGYLPTNQSIQYTSFNKVKSISQLDDNEDELNLDIIYGFDDQRRQTIFTNSGDPSKTRTKLFFGDYERIAENGNTKEYHYIYAPTGLCAIYEASQDSTEGNNVLWHVNTDHLGSIVYMFNSDNPSDYREFSYSAWGIPRDPEDWSQESTEPLFANRGFCGHEHLTEFGLINMNGRVYDPVVARFLSPDPYVQMPDARSGFNRYSYCLNNPLIYTDPDGEFFFTLLSALAPPLSPVFVALDAGCWTGLGNVIMNAGDILDRSDGKSFWNELGGYFGVGFAGGATSTIPIVGEFLSGGIISGGNAKLNGANNEEVLKAAWSGVLTVGIAGRISGGISPTINRITRNISNDYVRNITNEVVTNGISTFGASYFVGRGVNNLNNIDALKYAIRDAGISVGYSIGSGLIKTYQDHNRPDSYDYYHEDYYGRISEKELTNFPGSIDQSALNIHVDLPETWTIDISNLNQITPVFSPNSRSMIPINFSRELPNLHVYYFDPYYHK